MRNYNGWEVVNEALKFLSEKKTSDEKEKGVVGGAVKGAVTGAGIGAMTAFPAQRIGKGLGGISSKAMNIQKAAGKKIPLITKAASQLRKKGGYWKLAGLGAGVGTIGLAAHRAARNAKIRKARDARG